MAIDGNANAAVQAAIDLAIAQEPGPLLEASFPPAIRLGPETFARPYVRCACMAGVGGIFNARSEARFWAILANGGELDGKRLLSRAD